MFALVVLIALSAAATTARADSAREMALQLATSKTAFVSFRDLDLSSDAGAQVLYGRIKQAARGLCGPEEQYLRPPLRRAHRLAQCYRAAVDRAVIRANLERLTAVHRATVR